MLTFLSQASFFIVARWLLQLFPYLSHHGGKYCPHVPSPLTDSPLSLIVWLEHVATSNFKGGWESRWHLQPVHYVMGQQATKCSGEDRIDNHGCCQICSNSSKSHLGSLYPKPLPISSQPGKGTRSGEGCAFLSLFSLWSCCIYPAWF